MSITPKNSQPVFHFKIFLLPTNSQTKSKSTKQANFEEAKKNVWIDFVVKLILILIYLSIYYQANLFLRFSSLSITMQGIPHRGIAWLFKVASRVLLLGKPKYHVGNLDYQVE